MVVIFMVSVVVGVVRVVGWLGVVMVVVVVMMMRNDCEFELEVKYCRVFVCYAWRSLAISVAIRNSRPIFSWI